MTDKIRTPGTIDLTDQRVQVGDTVAFVEKLTAMQQKLEQWTAQDWDNFVSDIAIVAAAIEDAKTAAQNAALSAQTVVDVHKDEADAHGWEQIKNRPGVGDGLTIEQGNYKVDDTVLRRVGAQFLNGDLTVGGNLFVQGETVQVDSQISTADRVLILNEGEQGAGVTGEFSGVVVDRGSATNYEFGFNEQTGEFELGKVGDRQSVATREIQPIQKAAMHWDADAKRLQSYTAQQHAAWLDLGIAAYKNVGTEIGQLPEMGNAGLGGGGYLTATPPLVYDGNSVPQVTAFFGGGGVSATGFPTSNTAYSVIMDLVRSPTSQKIRAFFDSNAIYINYYSSDVLVNKYRLITSDYLSQVTGDSDIYVMSQKAVTDAIYEASNWVKVRNKPATFTPPNATNTVVGGLKARLDGTTLYLTNNGNNA